VLSAFRLSSAVTKLNSTVVQAESRLISLISYFMFISIALLDYLQKMRLSFV
jgi:hypothetical protein